MILNCLFYASCKLTGFSFISFCDLLDIHAFINLKSCQVKCGNETAQMVSLFPWSEGERVNLFTAEKFQFPFSRLKTESSLDVLSAHIRWVFYLFLFRNTKKADNWWFVKYFLFVKYRDVLESTGLSPFRVWPARTEQPGLHPTAPPLQQLSTAAVSPAGDDEPSPRSLFSVRAIRAALPWQEYATSSAADPYPTSSPQCGGNHQYQLSVFTSKRTDDGQQQPELVVRRVPQSGIGPWMESRGAYCFSLLGAKMHHDAWQIPVVLLKILNSQRLVRVSEWGDAEDGFWGWVASLPTASRLVSRKVGPLLFRII